VDRRPSSLLDGVELLVWQSKGFNDFNSLETDPILSHDFLIKNTACSGKGYIK
jgi:hypothetical protein